LSSEHLLIVISGEFVVNFSDPVEASLSVAVVIFALTLPLSTAVERVGIVLAIVGTPLFGGVAVTAPLSDNPNRCAS
jgi:hypothetical protein